MPRYISRYYKRRRIDCAIFAELSNSQKMKLPILRFRILKPKEGRLETQAEYKSGRKSTKTERAKSPKRTDIINYLISSLNRETTYLEIGVRNPSDNFDHIKATVKYSVDPGLEYKENPVDFQLTSDAFFEALERGDVLSKDIKFDVIFVDGLHLAEQVDKDIINSLKFLKEDGFVVLHDCNPPTEWHARETYYFIDTPAGRFWNGTTWKAFLKWRYDSSVNSCCINTDWGVGILSKKHLIGNSIEPSNPFYEYHTMGKEREKLLNLIEFDDLKKVVGS